MTNTMNYAFPLCLVTESHPNGSPKSTVYEAGLTKRELIAAMAMQSPVICDGIANDRQLDEWFGKGSTCITKPMIVARQAIEYADALLEALK